MHIYVNRQWTQVYGALLDETQRAETVKIVDAYRVVKEKKMPDWLVAKRPTLWSMESKFVQKTEQLHRQKLSTKEQMSKSDTAMSTNLVQRTEGKLDTRNECKGQTTIVLGKRMNTLLKSGADMYLVVILSSSVQKSGMTFKVKQQLMKEKGSIRKAPPIMETGEKMCKEASVAIRLEL